MVTFRVTIIETSNYQTIEMFESTVSHATEHEALKAALDWLAERHLFIAEEVRIDRVERMR